MRLVFVNSHFNRRIQRSHNMGHPRTIKLIKKILAIFVLIHNIALRKFSYFKTKKVMKYT